MSSGRIFRGRSAMPTPNVRSLHQIPFSNSPPPRRQLRTSRSQVILSGGKIFSQQSVTASTIVHTVDECNVMKRSRTQLRGRPSTSEDLQWRSPCNFRTMEAQITSATPLKDRSQIDEITIMTKTTSALKGHPNRIIEQGNPPPLLPQKNQDSLQPTIEDEIHFTLDESSIDARMSDRSMSPPSLSISGFTHIQPSLFIESIKQPNVEKKSTTRVSHPLLEGLEQLTQGLPSHLQMVQSNSLTQIRRPVNSPRTDFDQLSACNEYPQDDNLQVRLVNHTMRIKPQKGRFTVERERQHPNTPQHLKSPVLQKNQNNESPSNIYKMTEDLKKHPINAEPLQRDRDRECDKHKSPGSSSKIVIPHLITPTRTNKAPVIPAIKETENDDEEENLSNTRQTQERVFESEEENRLQLKSPEVSKICTVLTRSLTPARQSSTHQKQGNHRRQRSCSYASVQIRPSFNERISTIFEESKEETDRFETVPSNFAEEAANKMLQPLMKQRTNSQPSQETEIMPNQLTVTTATDSESNQLDARDILIKKLTEQILKNISQNENESRPSEPIALHEQISERNVPYDQPTSYGTPQEITYKAQPAQEQAFSYARARKRYGSASKENLPSFPTSPPRKTYKKVYVVDMSNRGPLTLATVPEQIQEHFVESSESSYHYDREGCLAENNMRDLRSSPGCSHRGIEEGFIQVTKQRYHQTLY